MPMKHEGLLFMSKRAAYTRTSQQGQFELDLLAFDRYSARKTQVYHLKWTGEAARAFYQDHKAQLKGGAVLKVALKEIYAQSAQQGLVAYIDAHIQTMEIVPKTRSGCAADDEVFAHEATIN